jgi:hypothetical protein
MLEHLGLAGLIQKNGEYSMGVEEYSTTWLFAESFYEAYVI